MNSEPAEGEGAGESLSKLLLAHRKDPAARNICHQLLKLYPFRPWGRAYRLEEFVLLPVEEDPLNLTSLPLPASEVLILSRHVSRSGLPTLSVHVPGRPEEGRLAIAKPETVAGILRHLVLAKEEEDLPHRVCLEATHHGPVDLKVPVTFVEIGSGKEEWSREEAGRAVAKALLHPLPKGKRAVGVGGTHYSPAHTEAVLKTPYLVGHLFPKYSPITGELLEEAVKKTEGGAELILMDGEGMISQQRKVVEETSARLGIPKLTVRQALSQKL